MAGTTEPTSPVRPIYLDQRIILEGVSWATYQKLAEEIGDRRLLKSYNRGVLELVSPGLRHERYRIGLDRIVRVVAEEFDVPLKCLGSTTWNDPAAERALEPDEGYLLTREKLAEFVRKRPRTAADCPRPDLVIEVDISRPAVDRTEVYATLGIAEVWRFDGRSLRIDNLRDDGTYEPATVSRFLPIPPAEVVRWVVHEEAEDDNAWSRRLRAWVRATLAPPPAGGA